MVGPLDALKFLLLYNDYTKEAGLTGPGPDRPDPWDPQVGSGEARGWAGPDV